MGGSLTLSFPASKVSCHRVGLTCYTVPAEQPRRLRAEPYYIAREVAAVLHYAVFFR